MRYQKPTVNLIDYTAMGKYGSAIKPHKVKDNIEGIAVSELTERFGSPLFVFSKKEIEQKFNAFKEAFDSRYPDVEFWWSYKTNYLDAICKVFHELGSKAEVVSEFEYQKARHLGIDGKDIIFNGPYKPKEALKIAVKEGAKIHIDHWYEINDLEDIAKEIGQQIDVAIRVNMNTGVYPLWSRFGFNYENNEALEAIERIHLGGKLNITGLHTHIGTFMLSADAYKVAASKLMQLRKIAQDRFGYRIEYIDLGGGFASRNRLKGIYQSPDVVVPSADEYAEAITTAIYENAQEDLPKLYLETGRALIDEAGYLLTTVHAAKRMADGKKSYILDAGVNILYTSTWYNFDIYLDRRYDGPSEPAQLNGPLCMNIDIVEENVSLPPLERGTILTLWPVGAYNVTQWMQFIRYRPAVVLIEDGKDRVIREAEDLDYIIEKER